MWLLRLTSIMLILSFLAGNVFCQTFQYSRGWTNGKRASITVSREAACQLHRLKAILDGKTTPQIYWPCEWLSYFDSGTITQSQASNLDVKTSNANDIERK